MVSDIATGGGGFSILGLAGGVPGPPVLQGTSRSGVALVGTSHGTSLLESGCEFCGACIDCRSGRTNLCSHGGIIGRVLEIRGAEGIAKVEIIGAAFGKAHGKIHPADTLTGRIVDRMRIPHFARNDSRCFNFRSASIDGKFRLTVEDHIHLLNIMVKVMANARLGINSTGVQIQKVC